MRNLHTVFPSGWINLHPCLSDKVSIFSTFLLTLVTSFLSDDNHPNRCEMISNHGFDLNFSDDFWCCIIFHGPHTHLKSSLEKYLINCFAHFLIVFFCYFCYWVFYIFWMLSLYKIYDLHFFPFSRLPSYFADNFTGYSEVFSMKYFHLLVFTIVTFGFWCQIQNILRLMARNLSLFVLILSAWHVNWGFLFEILVIKTNTCSSMELPPLCSSIIFWRYSFWWSFI